jgi:hypothetical protein
LEDEQFDSIPVCVNIKNRPVFVFVFVVGSTHLITRLPTAKITQIKEFTPAAWVKARGNEQAAAMAA